MQAATSGLEEKSQPCLLLPRLQALYLMSLMAVVLPTPEARVNTQQGKRLIVSASKVSR